MLIGRQKKILSKILVNYAGININENDYNRKVLKYKVRAVLTSNNDFNITNILKRWIEDRFKDSLTLVDNIPIHYADEYVGTNDIDLIISTQFCNKTNDIPVCYINYIPFNYDLIELGRNIDGIKFKGREKGS